MTVNTTMDNVSHSWKPLRSWASPRTALGCGLGEISTPRRRVQVLGRSRTDTDTSDLGEHISKTRGSSCPYLTVGPETFYHHITLDLILPEVPEGLFLLGIILVTPPQTSLHRAKAVESLP
jgi:hypothetical protein